MLVREVQRRGDVLQQENEGRCGGGAPLLSVEELGQRAKVAQLEADEGRTRLPTPEAPDLLGFVG